MINNFQKELVAHINSSSEKSVFKADLNNKKVEILPSILTVLNSKNSEVRESIVFRLEGFIIFGFAFNEKQLCTRCLLSRLIANPPQPLTSRIMSDLESHALENQEAQYESFPSFVNELIVGVYEEFRYAYVQNTIGILTISTGDYFSVPLIAIHACKCRGSSSIAGIQRFTDKLTIEMREVCESL